MKRNVPLAGLLALGSSLAGLAARGGTPQALPTPFPETRYQQMTARSPFAVASKTAATTAAPDFAAQLYVDGVAHVGQSDYVAIKSRDPGKPLAIFLEVGQSTDDGMKVERVRWSDEMGKSTVDVTKSGEQATLIFDEQTVKVAGNRIALASQSVAPQGGEDDFAAQEAQAPRPIDGPFAHPPVRRFRPGQ